jgi:hydrogenase maturation protein HypF
VADSHPGYLSRRWATERAASIGARLVLVQHHHAHLASLLAEHQWPPDEPVLGMAFDGTGYGTDGSIWGGEVLLGSYRDVVRFAHLAPVALPGGDAAIEHPARVALSHLHSAGLAWDERLPSVAAVAPADRRLLDAMLLAGSGCVPTTSMGRLFDAVSSLAGVCQHVGYEGQAAVELEALLVGVPVDGEYRFAIQPGTSPRQLADDPPMVIDPAPVLGAAVHDVLAGVPASVISARFHRAVALAVVDVARLVREITGVDAVGLTGGVFQNVTLTELCTRLLRADRFEVLVHRRVPANDGGLALGQAMIAGLDPER